MSVSVPAKLVFEIFTGHCVYQSALDCRQIKQYKIDEAKRGFLVSWMTIGKRLEGWCGGLCGWPHDAESGLQRTSPFLASWLLTCWLHYPLLHPHFFHRVENASGLTFSHLGFHWQKNFRLAKNIWEELWLFQLMPCIHPEARCLTTRVQNRWNRRCQILTPAPIRHWWNGGSVSLQDPISVFGHIHHLGWKTCAWTGCTTVHSGPVLPDPHLRLNRCQVSRTTRLYRQRLCI